MLLKTIYYYYFLFYNIILSEANPHITTVLALSFAESLIINAILTVIEVFFYCANITKWQGILVITTTVQVL